jgi:hypothetical protein
MNDEFIDNTIANLKIIGMLQRNQKLCVRKGQLTIERNDKLQFIRRWLHSDSRDLILLHIRNTINNAVRIARSLLDTPNNPLKNMYQYKDWTLTRIMQEMESTRHGLVNLKTTYTDDSIMMASLDVLIDRLMVNYDEIARSLDNSLELENTQLNSEISNLSIDNSAK